MIDRTERADQAVGPPEEPCALLLERSSRRPLHEVATVLSRHLAIDLPDARSRVRYGGGILADEIPRETAEAIASELREIGVSTRCVAPSSCWLEPLTIKAVTLEILPETLLVGVLTGGSLVFALGDVAALNLHGYPPAAPEKPDRFEKRWDKFQNRRPANEDGSIRLVLEGASMLASREAGLSPTARTLLEHMRESELERMSLHLTLYCLHEGLPARIRFNKDSADFSPLGDRKHEHSLENFLMLLEDVVDAVPLAWNRDRIQEFLEHPDPIGILHEKREETELYDRWILQWVDLEHGAVAPQPPEPERDP